MKYIIQNYKACFAKTTKCITNCDWILENSSKSHMKSSVFLHVFNDISTYVYVFTEYFLHSFSNLSIPCSAIKYYWECNTFHVAVINILK